MRFEKWQALGNDYAIIEAAALPFELTPGPDRGASARFHTGVGADGILLLSETDERGMVASLRIFNPDGSEAELSGNGVREAVMYLRRSGWTDSDSFSLQTAAGEVRPAITGPTTCTVDMGRATLTSDSYPSGGAGRRPARWRPAGRELRFQFVSIGNPQCAIEWGDGPGGAGPAGRWARRSSATSCFPTAPTSRSGARPATPRSARASSSAGWGRRCRPAPAPPARPWPRCCAARDSPVTVKLDGGELEVDVGEDLHVDLTGWAVPGLRGRAQRRVVLRERTLKWRA